MEEAGGGRGWRPGFASQLYYRSFLDCVIGRNKSVLFHFFVSTHRKEQAMMAGAKAALEKVEVLC